MTQIPDLGIVSFMKLLDYLSKEKLTFAKFAAKIGKNAQAIHKYAHFENYPRPKTAAKIVRATKGVVSLSDLYKEQPENGINQQ